MNDMQITVRISETLAQRLNAHLDGNPAFSRSSVVVSALDAFLPALPDTIPKKDRRRAPPGAGQDEASGREGRDFGINAGRRLAEKLGSLINPTATELKLVDGRHATIRTARRRNTQWGCLDSVLGRVDTIICAYTKDDRNFQLWEIAPEVWLDKARPASAGHKLHGKLTLIGKATAEKFGKRLPDQFL